MCYKLPFGKPKFDNNISKYNIESSSLWKLLLYFCC